MRAPRTLFWEFWDYWDEVLQQLVDRKVIDLKVWVGGNPKCSHHIYNFDRLELKGYQGYQGRHLPFYDELYQHLPIFYDMHSRKNRFTHHRYNLDTIHEYQNIFNILADYITGILLDNEIELVIINRPPHTGADYLMFQIAKLLNIKSVFLLNSRFVSRFFYTTDANDVGYFNNAVASSDDSFRFRFDEFDWYHLNGSQPKEKDPPTTNVIEAKEINDIMYNRPKLSLFQRVNELFNYLSLKSYFICLNNFTTHEIDLDRPYVYFPLHLQPELTTSFFGGKYSDQLLAIEQLASMIPDDWLIYVKENPSQKEFQRGENFFKRLSFIQKVRLVSKDTDTLALTKQSKFLATITGTAGWEALYLGKPVVIFGNAWYRTLPGVFEYNNRPNYQEICKYKIDREEFEYKVNLLLSKSYAGNNNPCRTDVVRTNRADNIRSTTHSMAKIVKNVMGTNVQTTSSRTMELEESL